jgi:16S rRNA (cytidine1402-2'-O)-methyltransferase
MLALMASGFIGQQFAFHGYLPAKVPEREKSLKELSNKVLQSKETQIFIEAPYRNEGLFQSIIKICQPGLQLCLAVDLTLDSEWIATKSIAEWRKLAPNINKRPAVFLLGE